MSVDLDRSRRGKFLKCYYYKRDVSNKISNDELVMKQKPTGVFYASIIGQKDKVEQDIANTFRVSYEGMQLETEDKVDIEQDDLILLNKEKWIVEKAYENIVVKNTEFSYKTSKTTTIYIRKGK